MRVAGGELLNDLGKQMRIGECTKADWEGFFKSFPSQSQE